MSRKVTFKLSGYRLNVALKFADDLGIDLNTAAERALFLVMRQAYDPNFQIQQAPLGNDSAQTDAPGDPDPAQPPALDLPPLP